MPFSGYKRFSKAVGALELAALRYVDPGWTLSPYSNPETKDPLASNKGNPKLNPRTVVTLIQRTLVKTL